MFSYNTFEFCLKNTNVTRMVNMKKADDVTGIILGMGSANERRLYYVIPSLIGQVQTQNDPCAMMGSVFISVQNFYHGLAIMDEEPHKETLVTHPQGWAMGCVARARRKKFVW